MNNFESYDTNSEEIKQQIISKFIHKYGNKSVGRRQVMEKVINNFIKSGENSEIKIRKLHRSLVQFKPIEKKIPAPPCIQPQGENQRQIYGLLASQQQPQRKPLSVNRPEFLERTQPYKESMRRQGGDSDDEEKKSVYMLNKEVQGDEWATMVKFDSLLYQRELEQKRKLKQIQREGIKAELDRQIEIKRIQKEQAQKEDDDYFRVQQQIWQKHDSQESQKLSERNERNNTLKKDRDFQIKMKTKRIKEEKKEESQLKQILTQKYISDAEQEEEMRRKKRIAEKEFLYKVMKQSEDDKQFQKQQELEQLRKEQEQFNKYGQFLDQTEKKKIEEKRLREEKIKRLMHRWDQNDYIKEFRDKVKEEEKLYDFYMKLANEKAERDENEKKLRKEREKVETNNILALQVKQHKQQQDEFKKIDKLQGEIWKEDTEKFFQEEKQKKEIIKGVNIQQKNILQQQILTKQKSQKNSMAIQKMTIDELMQNKDTLRKIIKENKQYNLEKVEF